MRREMLLAGMVIGWLTLSVAQAAAPLSFTRQPGDFVADAGAMGVAAGDLDGDGKMDLVISNDDADNVSVLWGSGTGSFLDSGAPINVGMAPFAAAVGDFNNDGKLDIATSDEIGNTVTVLLNQGSRAFAPAVSTDTGGTPQALVVADFNGDHFADVATANNDFVGTVTILFGVGDGTLFIAQSVTVGAEPVGLVVADLTGDTLPDLVVTNSGGGAAGNGTVSLLKGVAGGMFEAQPEIALPTSCGTPACVPVAVTIADLNGDSKLDIIVANNEGDTVSVLLNNGNLSKHCSVSTASPCSVDADCPQGETCLPMFAPSSTLSSSFSVASSPEWIVAADFDGDGRMDIATSGDFDDKVSVLVGNGDGTFEPSANFDVGAAPYGIVAAELNGDGKPDIASANAEGDTVSVLINTTGAGQVRGGDCNGDSEVTVNELITMVNIALGNANVSTCLAGDADGSGEVTINEIIAAVNNALTR